MTKKHWFLLETEQQYNEAVARYETIKYATAGEDHREKLLLVHLIANYEEKNWGLPEVDPVEMIKIRMEDFGYKASDLAAVYGDKGTVSKVLNYKQPLSLTMIRKFSEFLRLPAAALLKEYDLVN
ncbi:HTH-type transcriptional regulator / antitoxin HigA [Mucilaginibacter gossypiicola]|uniref:HTH-type transcriptional regulator / antitoxin HigA n=1 Tax=Mucilaginibacter gossypiicola TaxID=551995 RepID=A0A1H8M0G9_9SPHI|nr:XRE family transcriptional regulator [Mucilaginibacter gossypiicola]SEO10839.1 HTH-type transcriptional regulator / antitoxin HigA [Mucilaginibacter gossypiicola]